MNRPSGGQDSIKKLLIIFRDVRNTHCLVAFVAVRIIRIIRLRSGIIFVGLASLDVVFLYFRLRFCLGQLRCSRLFFLLVAVASFAAVLVFFQPLPFVGYCALVFALFFIALITLFIDGAFVAVSVFVLFDDSTTAVVVGAVCGPNCCRRSVFALDNTVAEDVVNEICRSDSDLVKSERRE